MSISILGKLGVPFSSTTAQKIPQAYLSVGRLSALLDELRIPNLTVRLKPHQLSDITFPAIAHCQIENQAYFVLLQSLHNGHISYYQEGLGAQTEAIETFAHKWSGTVLLLALDANSGEPNYEVNRKKERREKLETWLMWGALGVAVLGGIFLQANVYLSGILLLYGIGTAVSILLLQSEYGQPVEWVEKLCRNLTHSGGNKMGCNSVTQSSGGKIFGFSWAEIGLVYFGSGFLSSPLPLNGGILPLLSFMALLYVPFSLYYQTFVVRAWCMLCLVVQAINIAIAGLWYVYFGGWGEFQWDGFNWGLALSFLTSFGILGAFWLILKPIWQRAQQLPNVQRQLEQYQEDSSLFLSHLYAQPAIQIDMLPNETQIGNVDAPMVVLMVSNPHCNPCKDAYEELTGWAGYFEDEMQLRIRHIHSGEVQYQTHDDWAQKIGIEYTPTLFINGHQLRTPYGVKDVWRHVRALSEQIPA